MKLDINSVWLMMIRDIMVHGHDQAPRGMKTKELVGHRTQFQMARPIISLPGRKMGYRFMAASAAWILSGDNRVETIAPFSKTVSRFSDDGVTFFGAYGPKIREQLPFVIETLVRDPSSRQAVINIWRESPPCNPAPKDVPCTISHQFLIRENEPRNGKLALHVVTTMRSNDAWLGFVYDGFDVAMLAGYVMLALRDRYIPLELGTLVHTAGSRHLYENDWDSAIKVAGEGHAKAFGYSDFDPLSFASGDALIEHLWRVARREPTDNLFLRELPA